MKRALAIAFLAGADAVMTVDAIVAGNAVGAAIGTGATLLTLLFAHLQIREATRPRAKGEFHA